MPTFVTNRVVEPNLIGDQTVLTGLSSTDEFLVRRPSTNVLRKTTLNNILSSVQIPGTVVGTEYVERQGLVQFPSTNLLPLNASTFAITNGHAVFTNPITYSTKSSSNYVILQGSIYVDRGGTTGGTAGVLGLFANNTLIHAQQVTIPYAQPSTFIKKYLPLNTNPITYSVRVASDAGFLQLNQMWYYMNTYYNLFNNIKGSGMLLQEIAG